MPAPSALDLTVAVVATADALLRESQRLFRPHGLTAAQFNVLNLLADQPAGLSQREIGDVLVVDRSNVTGLLDRMGAAGWVRRRDDPADRRVYRVTLTPAGRRLWARVEPRYRAVAGQVAGGLTAAARAQCLGALRHMEQAAGRWTLPAERPAPG
ncbi:MAG: MarR family transcriptional regulator [Opitutaceae bacterium]|nr:MarR family transcriptional regulator [Opitutaceae bacterium]